MSAFKALQLTRYFSILSFVLIGLAGTALGLSAQYQAKRQVTDMAHRHNQTIARVFTNELWPHFSVFVAGSAGRSAADLRTAVDRLGLSQVAAH